MGKQCGRALAVTGIDSATDLRSAKAQTLTRAPLVMNFGVSAKTKGAQLGTISAMHGAKARASRLRQAFGAFGQLGLLYNF